MNVSQRAESTATNTSYIGMATTGLVKETHVLILSQGEYVARKSPDYDVGHIASHELHQRVRCATASTTSRVTRCSRIMGASVVQHKGITPGAQPSGILHIRPLLLDLCLFNVLIVA